MTLKDNNTQKVMQLVKHRKGYKRPEFFFQVCVLCPAKSKSDVQFRWP